ncbi:hypothetical protein BCR36DRAFT_398181 [Piromyces finnis]|uniref:Uncharacterized protein n=1 Tax=Piromyces finnis TaxID=1754191 RepID=A0A1Y1V6W4_9FUNG|nr:hypothetical protein BCR36DRAFT_398181 [Piromyces finnis]|eukprot:ORX48461.1 hypothetical protein BCR36DRAFT_398181 [Piromyces finnis]
MKVNSFRQEKKVKDVTNRMSIKKKVISPEEVYRNRRKVILPSDKDPEFTYGIPTRPPSPFNKVISYHYYREFEKKQEEDKKNELIQKKKLRHEHYERMAAPANLLSNLAAKRVQKKEEDPRNLFKMKKFSHAEPKIDSWWTLPPGASTIAKFEDEYEKQHTFESDPISSQKSATTAIKKQRNNDTTEMITEENLPTEECYKSVQRDIYHQHHPCHCHDSHEENYYCEYDQDIPEEE